MHFARLLSHCIGRIEIDLSGRRSKRLYGASRAAAAARARAGTGLNILGFELFRVLLLGLGLEPVGV